MLNIEENRLFQTIVFLLFLLTLFYGSDFMSIWEAESGIAISSLDNLSKGLPFSFGDGFSPLAELIISGGLSTVGFSEWGIRISSLLILVASFLFFYKLGAKVFSEKPTLLAILLAASSFPLLLIGKIATTDIWLFGLQLLIFSLTIIQLKKKNIVRTLSIIILSVLLVFINPLSALIFNTLFFAVLYFLHENGKNILIEGIISTLAVLLITLISDLNWVNSGFLFSYDQDILYYIVFVLFGMISVFGFIPTVFVHLFKRLKIKEELAVITFAGLFSGLFSISFLPHFILLFLVGKQLELVEHKNYPYLNQIKAFTIIQVVLSFFVALLFMLNGFAWFQGSGFWKALFFGIPLWGLGIFTLVSIYLKKKQQIIVSIILGGMISNFLLWTQIMPLWEAEKNTMKDIVNTIHEINKEKEINTIYFDKDLSTSYALEFYNKTILKDKEIKFDSPTEKNTGNNIIYITEMDSTASHPILKEIKTIKGREFPWQNLKTYTITRQ